MAYSTQFPGSPWLNGTQPQKANGLLGLLGVNSNPFLDFLGNNSNALIGLGAGLAGGGPDIGQAIGQGLQLGGQGKTADYNRRLQQNMLDLQIQQRNQTADWAERTGHKDWADLLRSGAVSGSDVFNLMNKQTVVPNGASVVNSQGQTVSGPPAGSFAGNDLKSQAWNVVMAANAPGADPSLKQDPKFLSAWAIATEPTMTPQGMMQPNVPGNWGPTAGGAAPAGYSPPSGNAPPVAPGGMGSDVAPIGAMANSPQQFNSVAPPGPTQLGPGVIPGTQPFNESQARVGFLSNSSVPDIKRVVDLFPALMNTKDQLLQGISGIDPTGLARASQSPLYKQASDAMRSAMGNVLYFASGANLNAGELQRKVDAYVPSFGDDPQTAVNKLDRFANDVISMANATKDPQTIQWAQQAIVDIKQTEQSILAGGASKQPVTGKTSTGVPWSLN